MYGENGGRLRAELAADGLENRRKVTEIGLGVPVFLLGQAGALGGLVVISHAAGLRLGCHAVDGFEAGNGGLDTDGPVTEGLVRSDRVEQLGQVPP